MWWRNSVPRHLPMPQGPYVPGCVDIMTGLSVNSSFVRIYYPSTVSKDTDYSSQWIPYMPHGKYYEGFAHITNSWPSLVRLLVWSYGGEPKIPVAWEAPVREGKYPVIVFSHGFGATRFLSSTIGAELASHGFIFASLEHREKSACTSYFYETKEDVELNRPSWIRHEKMNFSDPNHYVIRNTQLHERKKELCRLLDDLEDLNEGKGTNILPSKLDPCTFKGTMDLSSLVMMGHSFGGAATLLTMAHDDRVKAGGILDGWMYPLREEKVTVAKPLIFINTQTFHFKSNLIRMDDFIKEPEGACREVYTMHHTTHESQTDTPHLIGNWKGWFMHKLTPTTATELNNHLLLRFLNKYLGSPGSVKGSQEFLDEHKEDFVEGTYLYTKGERDFNFKSSL